MKPSFNGCYDKTQSARSAEPAFLTHAKSLVDQFTDLITTRAYIEPDKEELAMTLLRSFLADETGATAIEYGLIAAGVALAIVTIVTNTGSVLLNNKFNSISSAMK
jgi:pilus assembly protein Flp/PilA